MITDRRLRHLFWLGAELGAALLLALALFVIVVRVALPQIDQFKPQIERWASDAVGRPVRIEAVAAYWPGLDLTVVLDRVAVLDARGQPEIEFARAYLDLDLLASLWRQQPTVNELHLDGLELQLGSGPEGVALAGVGSAPERAAAVRPGVARELFAWLLAQERLDITSGRLSWHGAAGDTPPFDRFSLRARNRGQSHRLALRLDGRDGWLDLAAEIHGPVADPTGWRGAFYVGGQGVAWSPLAGLVQAQLPGLPPATAWFDAARLPGRADLRLWGDLAGGALTRLVGEATLSAPRGQPQGGLDRVAGRFDWRPEASGWRVDLDRLELHSAGTERVWLGPGGIRLTHDVAGAVAIEAGLATLDLRGLHGLVAASGRLPPEIAEMVAGMQPMGRLHDLRGRWQPGDAVTPARWRLVGEAWDLALLPWRKWPGVDGLRLRFDAGPDGGRTELDGTNARVTLPGLFREPLRVTRLAGEVTVDPTAAGWVVRAADLAAANDDITTRSRLELRLPAGGGAPWIDLAVAYRDGDAATTPRYLPVGIMNADVVAWTDRALVDGRVVRGGMLLHGPLDRFPFDAGDGRFQVRFLVDDLTLDYLEGWPRIEDLAAWVEFDGRGLAIDSQRARIFAARLEEVTARVADLTAKPAALVIAGSAVGDAGDGLRYLRESPLRDSFGDYLAVARGQGGLRLDLDLGVPLGAGKTRVAGRIDLDDAVLELPDFAMSLAHARGRLDFTEETLVGSALTAEWRGMPVTLDVQVPDDGAGGAGGPRIDARGVATAAQFDDLLPTWVHARLIGGFAWQATVSVREAATGKVDQVTIAARSDLTGLALDLPAPLGKPRAQSRPLQVEMHLPSDGRPRLQAAYGPLAVVGELQVEDGVVSVPRAELRLGTGPAILPERRLWRGDVRLDTVDLAAWRALLQPLGASSPVAPPPLELRARFDSLPLDGAGTLHDVDLTLAGVADAWQLDLLSREAVGRLHVPRGTDRLAPVVAEFSRLALDYDIDAVAGDAGPPDHASTTDPRHLPALRVTVASLLLNGDGLGALELVAEPDGDGLRFTRLQLADELWSLRGSGHWSVTEQGVTSGLDFTLQTSDLDRLDKALGLDGQLEVGAADYRLALTWPGAPSDFALATLSGTFHGQLTDGVLKEVEPGIGRVFSLVNLRQLQRRLTLDFSDLFGRGMQFDSITGNFILDRGHAYTNDLLIKTSSATINIMGRTGLVARDYDQLMTVLPHFSGALPLAGAVLGGPAVGAALLLFNQLFATEVDELSRVQYRITGPWEDPLVERVSAEPEPSAATGEIPQTD